MTHRKRKKASEKKKKGEGVLLVISDGKSFFGTGLSMEILLSDAKHRSALYGRRIGEIIDGKDIGFAGYEFKITGGTDKYGFMHHPGVEGTELKKIILRAPPGIRFTRFKKEKRDGGHKFIDLRGIPRKKTVRGNTISEVTRQVNMIVISRRGQSIKGMKKESILSDRILAPFVEKLGLQVLKNGLYRVRFIQDDQIIRLDEKLKEVGVTDDFIKNLSIELGIEFIKRGKKFIQGVIKPIIKLQGNHAYAKYVAKVLYEFYLGLKEGKIDINDTQKVLEQLKNMLLEGAEKAQKGELKVRFNFKIKANEAS